METVRKLITFLALLFLVFALLVLLNIISADYLDSTLTTFNPLNFFKAIFGVAAAILLLVLIVDYLYTMSLKREKSQLVKQVNELKATLYDRKIVEPRVFPKNDPNDLPPPKPGPPSSFPNRNSPQ